MQRDSKKLKSCSCALRESSEWAIDELQLLCMHHAAVVTAHVTTTAPAQTVKHKSQLHWGSLHPLNPHIVRIVPAQTNQTIHTRMHTCHSDTAVETEGRYTPVLSLQRMRIVSI
jgi:hypothetical protein